MTPHLPTLERVLLFLRHRDNVSEGEVRDLAGEHWPEVKRYLESNRIVIFDPCIRLNGVRRGFIDGHLEDMRLRMREEKLEEEEKRKEKRMDLRQQIKLGAIVSLITIVMTLAVEHLWQWATRQDKTDDNTEQHTDNQKETTDSLKSANDFI